CDLTQTPSSQAGAPCPDTVSPSKDGTAVVNSINVAAALPNGGLKVVTASTPSALSPMPIITVPAISMGPFPTITVAGAQTSYLTTLYDSGNRALGQLLGNGTIQVSTT